MGKQNFILELVKQNQHLEKEIREIRKVYEDKIFIKPKVEIVYPIESKYYVVREKLLANMIKKIENYEKESQKLQQRVSLLASDYPAKLEKKVAKRQKKLEFLLASNEKFERKHSQIFEKNFQKDLQSEKELKSFYEKKIQDCEESLLKSTQKKSEIQEKLTKTKQVYSELKSELLRKNNSQSKSFAKSLKFLRKSFQKTQSNSNLSIKRYNSRASNLKSELKSLKGQESIRKALLSEFSRISDSSQVSRSYSQSKPLKRSLHLTPIRKQSPQSFYN